MSRLEVTGVKGIGALIISFSIYMVNAVNEAVVVLIFFMILDLVTGLIRSWATKSLDSTVGFAGVFKKVAIFILIGMAAAIEFFVMATGQDTHGLVLLGTSSFFIVNEGISILENCAQIGLPIPAVLFNALQKLHKDPTGKDQRLARHPVMDRIDKTELLKEHEALQNEIRKLKEEKMKVEEETKDEN